MGVPICNIIVGDLSFSSHSYEWSWDHSFVFHTEYATSLELVTSAADFGVSPKFQSLIDALEDTNRCSAWHRMRNYISYPVTTQVGESS